MIKKRLALFVAALACVGFVSTGVLVAADIPEEITISNEGYKKDTKGPVIFDHKKHAEDYGIACSDCHHDYQNGQNVWKEGDPVKKCNTCHNPEKKQGNVDKLNTAYHNNCKNCHKEQAPDTAPYKKCEGCHQKK